MSMEPDGVEYYITDIYNRKDRYVGGIARAVRQDAGGRPFSVEIQTEDHALYRLLQQGKMIRISVYDDPRPAP
jgi:hypothetical protein